MGAGARHTRPGVGVRESIPQSLFVNEMYRCLNMKSVSDIRARLKFVKVIYVPFEVRFNKP